MPRFKIKFSGRKRRAIGSTQVFTVVIEADTERDAMMELYDRYEHISLPMVKLLSEGEK